MDSSFISLQEMIEKILDIQGAEIKDDDTGIHFYIDEMEVGTPIELDVVVDENGKVKIGAIPPLYRVNTSYRPSYHQVNIIAKKYTEDGRSE